MTSAANTPNWRTEGQHQSAQTADDRDQASGFDLALYLRMALKHRLLIAGLTVAALIVGIILTLLATPIYTASATIQIDREATRNVDLQERRSNENANLAEFMSTQYGLLESRSLAERVVDQLGLAQSNVFFEQMGMGSVGTGTAAEQQRQRRNAAVGALQKGMDIAPVSGSRLVRIQFASPDPEVSSRIANAYAENFIQQNIDRKFESTSYIRSFLEQQIDQTKGRLEEAERQLVAYASNQQIINTQEGGADQPAQSLATTDLVAQNSALAEARTARLAAEARWRQAQATSLMSLPEVLANTGIQTLIQQRATLEADYQQKLAVYKADYPAMVQLRTQIDTLNAQINNQATAVRNSIRDQYAVASNQERALSSAVSGLKGDVLNQRERAIQYNILERELDTTRQLYDGLLQRYKEVGVTGDVTSNNVQIIDRAQTPRTPSSPNLLMNCLVAVLVGLALGAVVAFILEALDESLATPEDIESKVGVTTLGVIPMLEAGQTPTAGLDDIRSGFSEAYYALRTALEFSTPEGTPNSLLVTSSRPGEGKSTTAYAIAHNLARIGRKVLLVDGDLRRPSLHRVVGANNDKGLSNILSGSPSIEDKVQPTPLEGLGFIACGPIPPNPAELWGSDRVASFIQTAVQHFDHVVIDGPPVLGFADVPILASQVKGVLFVAESRGAKRSQVRGALRRIATGGAHLLGVVLTKFNARSLANYGAYDYAYSYDYSAGDKAKPKSKRRLKA